MSDKGVVEIYRAKSGFQAHMFVLALEEAGIKAEIQGAILHHATSTADNGFTSSSLWCRSVRSAASISMSAVRNCLSNKFRRDAQSAGPRHSSPPPNSP